MKIQHPRFMSEDNILICPFCGYKAIQIGLPVVESDDPDYFNLELPLACTNEHTWNLSFVMHKEESQYQREVRVCLEPHPDDTSWIRIQMDNTPDEEINETA